MTMMRTLASLLTGLTIATALHAAPASPAHPEIERLLARLQESGCEFNRNGSWYSGADAKTHLLRKLDYLEGKNAVHSTEQFIALAATSSSASGKAYQVRCAKLAPTPSATWLLGELKALRAADPPPR